MTILALDIGGTNLKSGLVDGKKVANFVSFPTLASKGKKTALAQIEKIIALNYSKKVRGIAVSMPGPADYPNGTFRSVQNLPLKNFKLKKHLQKKFGVPVNCTHDAHAFALGESRYGAARGKKNIVGITLGTGVGFGILLDGKPFYGRGNAAELGHTVLEAIDARTVEDFLGDRKKHGGILGADGGRTWFGRAQKGDSRALGVWQAFGHALGMAIANCILSFDPDVVVVGGNVAEAWPFFEKSMKKSLQKTVIFRPCPVVKGKLAHAALLGAAELAQGGDPGRGNPPA